MIHFCILGMTNRDESLISGKDVLPESAFEEMAAFKKAYGKPCAKVTRLPIPNSNYRDKF